MTKAFVHCRGVAKYMDHSGKPQATTLKSYLLKDIWQARKVAAPSSQRRLVLNDVSFSCTSGNTLALIGHNGAGKSTLLKIIARILRPDRGEVEVAGRVVGLIELGAGFHPELTGRENIYINAALLGLRKCEIKAKMAEIIAFSGIEYAIDSPVRTYSSGMHARLGFAIAVHVQPDILLIDEILAVGDMQFTQKCYQALTRLKHNNTCIVMASHQLELLPQWCEQTLWLENGLMRAYGNTDEVVALYQYAYQKEESQLAF